MNEILQLIFHVFCLHRPSVFKGVAFVLVMKFLYFPGYKEIFGFPLSTNLYEVVHYNGTNSIIDHSNRPFALETENQTGVWRREDFLWVSLSAPSLHLSVTHLFFHSDSQQLLYNDCWLYHPNITKPTTSEMKVINLKIPSNGQVETFKLFLFHLHEITHFPPNNSYAWVFCMKIPKT